MSKKQNDKWRYFKPSMLWVIWMFPSFAVVMTGYIFYDYFEKRGPLVKIHFADAAGVEVQKTILRFRGITVGRVEKIVLSADTKEVVVEARLNREAHHLAVEGTSFGIVEPEVGFEGIRGL